MKNRNEQRGPKKLVQTDPASTDAVNGVPKPRRMTPKRADAILKDEREREWAEIDKRQSTTKKLTVEVDAFNWGLLNAGALINNCTPEEALSAYLNSGDGMNDWWNEGCPI